MNSRKLTAGVTLLSAIVPAMAQKSGHERPNILLIVADDLGKGDISTYGSRTIMTPNIDALAHQGLCFNNGYATSATSTPSRYAMFTGMYPWTNPNAKILPGDAPLLIAVDQPTFPKALQDVGYSTAAIGKWHLGMGAGNIDWNEQISPSANTVGFDYTCLIAATNDRVPTVYVRNGKVLGLDPNDPIEVNYSENFEGEPTALSNPEMLRLMWHHGHNNSIVNGIPRIGFMKGGEAAKWVDEDMADYFVGEVKSYLDTVDKEKPFFLYYGLHQPHVPRLPNARFAGSTNLGPRGDAVVEADWCVGEIMKYLEEHSLAENTLVIFTSDNGAVLQDGYLDDAEELALEHGHLISNGMRGGKYSLFDGGAHVPFIASWKGKISPGETDAFFSQMDLFASLGAITGAKVPSDIDSRDYSKVLLGKSKKGRNTLILEAKMRLCMRDGNYVLIPPYNGAKRNKNTHAELGNFKDYVLYDLSSDPGQQHDISAENPKLLEKMKKKFHSIVGDYYSLEPNY